MSRRTRSRRIPGESGIWVFLMGDMLVFGELFFIFVLSRAENMELFNTSQQLVNPVCGLVYTFVLLASSWSVVMALCAARRNLLNRASRLVMWGLAGGAVFVIVKFVEYTTKLSAGITPFTNQFFMLYFVLTFVHLLHACFGMGLLIFVRSQVNALGLSEIGSGDRRDRFRIIEVCAVYWHMVDLLWIVLFALFYLRG